MKTLSWNQLDDAARAAALARPVQAVDAELETAVSRIIEQVRADGDSAIRALTRRFDGIEVGAAQVDEAQFTEAR
ncbi:MAG: histidinol dehydrogenase, partial [Frankiaceae bacterium]|nr:histidinol dehydrogenase [Arenimonas sp.]